MWLARVIGEVWGAQHVEGLDGLKLLETRRVRLGPGRTDAKTAGVAHGDEITIAVDALGAGPGELVLVAHGSRVRDLTVGREHAVKDIVVAIVDVAEVG